MDFNTLLQKFAQLFQLELNKKIYDRISLNGQPYSPIEKDTLKESKRHRTANSRLNDTEVFSRAAIVCNVENNSISVTANQSTYPGGNISYERIILYNDYFSPLVNKNIHRAPIIFPHLQEHITNLQSAKDFEKELNESVSKQLETLLPKNQTIELKFGV
jgi:hypothetical protein